jgi:phosphoenolpyruvate---glycerone phosphotransferase subunit DhaL
LRGAGGLFRTPPPFPPPQGRASYLGERSKDHQDPGATSTYYLFKTAAEALSG